MKIKIGVIFGGESVEHEISIISAVQAMDYLDQEKYEIIPIYITKEREWYTGHILKSMDNYKDLDLLKKYSKKVVLYNKDGHFVLQSKRGFRRIINEIDIALPIVHGQNIEDGTLAGYLNLIGIPYVGSDVYASSVGQDKVFMKQIFEANKIPITDYVWFFDSEYKEDSTSVINKIKKLKMPLIVKPARLGSSVGINKVREIKELEAAIEEAMQYDNKIVVEEMITDLKEVNCSVLGNYEYQQRSELDEVVASKDFLSYEDKYMSKGKLKGGMLNGVKKGTDIPNHVIPAKIDAKLRDKIIELSKESFKALNCSGVVRFDFLIDNSKETVYVNEVNTIPGSLSFYLWQPAGKNYTTLLDDMINLAIREYKKKSKMKTSFDTNILQNFNGLKGQKGKVRM